VIKGVISLLFSSGYHMVEMCFKGCLALLFIRKKLSETLISYSKRASFRGLSRLKVGGFKKVIYYWASLSLVSMRRFSSFKIRSMKKDIATERYEELLRLVEETKEGFDKFYGSNVKVWATRLRKKLTEIANYAKKTRSEVQDIKNDMKSKGK